MAKKPKINLTLKKNDSEQEIKNTVKKEKTETNYEVSTDDLRKPMNLISQIEKTNTSKKAFDLKDIPYEKIIFSEDNDFDTSDEECLKKGVSVLENGLVHNMSAVYDIETDTYILLSGEKRVRGCLMQRERKENGQLDERELQLYEENIQPFFDIGFPINVRTGLSKLEQKILINAANMDVTRLTPQELSKKIEEQKELYRLRAEEKGQAKKTFTKEIADNFQMDQRQVQKYNKINTSLIPELKKLFDEQKITVNEGSSFAGLSEEEQRQIFKIAESGRKVSAEEISIIKKESEEKQKHIAELKEKIQNIEAEAERERKKIEEEKEQIKKDQKKIESELREQLKKAELEKSPDEDKIRDLSKRLEDLKDENIKKEHHTQEMEQQISSKEDEIAKLHSELEAAKNKKISDQEKARLNDEIRLELLTENLIKDFDLVISAMNKHQKTFKKESIDLIEKINNRIKGAIQSLPKK